LRSSTEWSADNLVTLGEILAPHGLRGEVRVWPTTDFPERFAADTRVFVTVPTLRQLTIERARPHKNFLLIQFKEVRDRNAAELLRGGLIQVPEAEVVPLPEGHYYRFQLVGLTVITEEGTVLGTVEEVLETGANDVLVVKPADPQRARPYLLPAIRQVVRTVDLEAGKIRVRLLPGLLDL